MIPIFIHFFFPPERHGTSRPVLIVVEDICGFQEELLNIQANQVLKENFSQKCLTQFEAQLKDKRILSKEAENALLPFPITYLM